jgi:hypothetical protein
MTHRSRDFRNLQEEGLGEREKKIKGVLFRCKADTEFYKQETGRTEQISATELSKNAIWNTDSIEFFKMMGLPLLVHKLPPNPAWDQNDSTSLENLPATSLNLSVDPNNAQWWGVATPDWKTNVGRVILVRKDGKDLSPEQGWALAKFMQSRVSLALQKTPDARNILQRRATVLKMVNWTQFDTFLEKSKVEMAPSSNKWLQVRSPLGLERVVIDSHTKLDIEVSTFLTRNLQSILEGAAGQF